MFKLLSTFVVLAMVLFIVCMSLLYFLALYMNKKVIDKEKEYYG